MYCYERAIISDFPNSRLPTCVGHVNIEICIMFGLRNRNTSNNVINIIAVIKFLRTKALSVDPNHRQKSIVSLRHDKVFYDTAKCSVMTVQIFMNLCFKNQVHYS